MKLPWDEKYLRISFHVIFTFVVIYVLTVIFNAVMYSFTNINVLIESVSSWLSKTSSLLSPILTAFLIAYMLDPAVDFFQEIYDKYYKNAVSARIRQTGLVRRVADSRFANRIRAIGFFQRRAEKRKHEYKRRGAGVVTVIFLILAAFAVIVVAGFKVTSMTSISFSADSVQIISKTVNDFNDFIFKIQAQLADIGLLEYLSTYIERIATEVTRLVSEFSNNIINIITSTGSGILSFLLAFVVSVYYMRDKAKYLAKSNEIMDTFVPRRANRVIRNLLGDINAIFSGYIRGQITDAVIMAVLIGTYLSIINVQFSFIIGIFSGISNLIPYFGAIIAFILSVFVALLSGDPGKAVYAAVGIIILQQIDGMFIVPRVVGAKVELSPVLVIISLSIAGTLFGLIGMLLAVPICAIIKLLLGRFLQRQKLKKEMREAG